MASLEFAGLISLEVVDLIATAIDKHRPGGSHDCRTAISPVILHPLATLSFPRNHFVFVLEAGHERVIKLPIVFEMVSAARRGNPLRIVDSKRPTADIDLVRAIIECFAGAINFEPVPVIRMHIVFIGTAWGWTLPQIPIELRRHGYFFAGANRFPRIDIPGSSEVGPADHSFVNLRDDLDGVRRGALLRSDLHELAILLLRLHQHLALSRVVTAGLLHVHVLARLQAGDRHRCMPMLRSGNRDGVNVFLFQYLAKVFLRYWSLTHFLLRTVGELFENIAVHIRSEEHTSALQS